MRRHKSSSYPDSWIADNDRESHTKGQRYAKHPHGSLQRSQSHECLLMPVIQINRNISVIDSRHISIENTGNQPGILFFSRYPMRKAASRAIPRISQFRLSILRPVLDGCTLSCGRPSQGIVAESHVSFRTIVIRYYIFQFRSTMRSGRPSCSGIANCRGRCLRASGMVEHLTFHVHFRCMRLPVHGQTG